MILPRTITIFSIDLHLYGIIIGIVVAIIYFRLEKSYPNKHFTLLFIFQAFVSLLLGRLFFIALDLSYFLNDPIEILAITNGGISLFGVLFGFIISSLLTSKKLGTSYFALLDEVFAILPLAQAVGRIGNFINQELFGPPTNLFWGIFIEEKYRPTQYKNCQFFHPLFLYEMILNLISFVIINRFVPKTSGYATGIYLINYGIIRLLMNRLRLDLKQLIGVFSIQDFIAIVMIIAGLLIIKARSIYSEKHD